MAFFLPTQAKHSRLNPIKSDRRYAMITPDWKNHGIIQKPFGRLARKNNSAWHPRLRDIQHEGSSHCMGGAAEREAQLRRSDATGIVAGKTCLQAFERYRDNVSVHKKSARWETIRPSDYPQSLTISSPTRNWRLPGRRDFPRHPGAMARYAPKTVLASTVNRDLNLISHVFTTARREWHWIAKSPTADPSSRLPRSQGAVRKRSSGRTR